MKTPPHGRDQSKRTRLLKFRLPIRYLLKTYFWKLHTKSDRLHELLSIKQTSSRKLGLGFCDSMPFLSATSFSRLYDTQRIRCSYLLCERYRCPVKSSKRSKYAPEKQFRTLPSHDMALHSAVLWQE